MTASREATIRQVVIQTRGRGLHDITAAVVDTVRASGAGTGLVTVFCRHTSASLVIQENADPDVQRDLEAWLGRLVQDGDPLFRHVDEGPDDMSAHVRAALTQASVGIPVIDGRPALGTWQGVYLWEHRTIGRAREVVIHVA